MSRARFSSPVSGSKLASCIELGFALMALGDRAHDAVRAQRLAVGTGEPAAGILQPDFLVAALEGVLHLIGNAAAGVA